MRERERGRDRDRDRETERDRERWGLKKDPYQIKKTFINAITVYDTFSQCPQHTA